jgi:hypothetical protein
MNNPEWSLIQVDGVMLEGAVVRRVVCQERMLTVDHVYCVAGSLSLEVGR